MDTSSAAPSTSDSPLAAQTSRAGFMRRLAGLTAIGLGIAGVQAAIASAQSWSCCYSAGSGCASFCSQSGKWGYNCTTSGCPDWCNCQDTFQGSCFSTSTGPC